MFKKYKRRSIRLKNYDYSMPGFYYITICTYEKEMLFGKVVDCRMILNKHGDIAKNEWQKTCLIRKNVRIDYFIIMPDHMHGILQITKNNVGTNVVGAYRNTPLQKGFKSPSNSIGAIIRGYKSAVTKQINMQRNTSGMPVWQRNYYEHIIRNENELNQIRKYVVNNPRKWGQ